MPVLPRELHNVLVNPNFAAQVQVCPLILDDPGNADATVVVFVASRRCKLIRASYLQAAGATAATSYTAQLKNGSTNLSAALDIKALAADTVADFASIPTDKDAVLADGDILDLVFDETGGTVTAPGRVALTLEFQLLE
jgi:hypothetical protein